MRTVARHLLVPLLVGCLASSSVAQLPAVARAEDVGLSSKRLERIGELVKSSVDQNQVAGAVTVIARRGKVAHIEAFGMMDREAAKPMRTDTIFRIASMTKPVTSVAVMMLFEEADLQTAGNERHAFLSSSREGVSVGGSLPSKSRWHRESAGTAS